MTTKSSTPPEETISSKLLKRLNAFTPTTSPESTQTLANWILFHARHHETPLQTTLRSFLGDAAPSATGLRLFHQVFWNLLNELCTMHYSEDAESKWNLYSDFRLGVGEQVLLPSIQALNRLEQSNANNKASVKLIKDSLLPMIDSWDAKRSFGHTACIEDLRDALAASPAESVQKQALEPSNVDTMEESTKSIGTAEETPDEAADDVREPMQASTPVPSDDDDDFGDFDTSKDQPKNLSPQTVEPQETKTTDIEASPKEKKSQSPPAATIEKRPPFNKSSSFSTVKIDFEAQVSD